MRDKDLRTQCWIAKNCLWRASLHITKIIASIYCIFLFLFPSTYVQRRRPIQSSLFYTTHLTSLQSDRFFFLLTVLFFYSGGNSSETPPDCRCLEWDLLRFLKLILSMDSLITIRFEGGRVGAGQEVAGCCERGNECWGEYFDWLRKHIASPDGLCCMESSQSAGRILRWYDRKFHLSETYEI